MLKRLLTGLLLLTFLPAPTFLLAARSWTTGSEQTSGAVSVAVGRDDASATRLSVNVDEFASRDITNGGEIHRTYALDQGVTTVDPGFPQLPMITRTVLVPPTAGIRLEIKNVESRTEPAQPWFIVPPQDGSADTNLSGAPSNEFIRLKGLYPPQPVVISKPAILRGNRLVQVSIFPVQVNPATGITRFNDLIDFELVYEGIGDNIVLDPKRPRPSASVDNLLKSHVINPPHRDDDATHPDRGSYLLIYPRVDGVEEALQPLIDWRARQGWEVHTADVRNNASTNTVKDIIEEAYEEWDNPPEMVTLVGDAGGRISISAYNQTDLDYVLLEGNDVLAEADIGRISVDRVNQLENVVEKLVNYEADPWMEDTEWYRRGMVCAGSQISGLSTILVNRWVRRELIERGFDSVHEWYFNDPFEGMTVPEFFESEFERGISFSNYRGWVGIENLSQNQVMNFRDHRRYPTVVLLTCSSGNYINVFGWTEAFLRSPGGGNGAVGLCTNNTHVQFNNAISVGIWLGFLKEGLYNFGSAVNRGRFELWRQYDGHLDNDVRNFSRWTNLMGDPATHVFTDVPRTILVDHTESLPLGGSRVYIDVSDEEEEVPLVDALVCLYKEDDEFQSTAYTGENGRAEFALSADGLSEGDLLVTVTKHNTVPYLGEIEVVESEHALLAGGWMIDDDGEGESMGDADETVNPGEIIELTVVLENMGVENIDGEIDVIARSLSNKAELAADSAHFDEAPEVGESVEATFAVQIDGNAEDGERVLIAVEAVAVDGMWESVVPLEIVAARLEITEFAFDNGDFGPGELSYLDLEVSNTGRKTMPAFQATLGSLRDEVQVIETTADFPEIETGETASVDGDLFRVRAHPFAIPGVNIPMVLEYRTEAGVGGFTRETVFSLGQPREGDPFGPDEYGYVCFDSGDEGWEMTPVYEWVEIDPDEDDNDFEGDDLRLSDRWEDDDESEVVDLPFEFQYYGETFDELTVCSNGWAAFGDWEQFVDFRNRRIASGGGPNAQLCVFWDNLLTTNGRVLTYYDEEGGRFIVEWNNLRRQWGGAGSETFQLILLDTRLHPTYTGDGSIIYQYKEIQNGIGNDLGENDTPYATVGIGSLDDQDGLQYTYWNAYHAGAMPLQDEMAIKFTTAVNFITGVLTGTVVDADDDSPVPNSQITTSRGFWAETDENGVYVIDDILIGEGYVVTASAQGYNDSTDAGEDGEGYVIEEGDTVRVDFALLHPEFNLSRNEFRFQMNEGDTLRTTTTLSNEGNGFLNYTSRFVYNERRDDPDEMWDPILTWTAGDSVDDSKIQGVAYVGDEWIVSGGGAGRLEENWFYRFDRDGNYLDRMPQPIPESRYGIRDLAFHGGFLYGAFPDDNLIIRIDPESGEALKSWETPGRLRTGNNLAIDPDGYFWVSSITTDIYKLGLIGDTAFVELERYSAVDPRDETERIRNYGLAWHRDDPDGYRLYIIANNEAMNDPEEILPEISVYKMRPDDGDIRFLTNLPTFEPDDDGRGGLFISSKWNPRVLVMAAVIDNPAGDKIAVLELAPNSSWIDYSPREAELNAGESVGIELTIITTDLDTTEYGVDIEFRHNAGDGVTTVPVDLLITSLEARGDAGRPREFALLQNYPNPFNPSTTITYNLREPGLASVELLDVSGRTVRVLSQGFQSSGRHRLIFDASALPTGVYLYRLQSGRFTQTRKMIIMK